METQSITQLFIESVSRNRVTVAAGTWFRAAPVKSVSQASGTSIQTLAVTVSTRDLKKIVQKGK